MLLLLSIPIICLLINMFFQLVSFRLIKQIGLLKSMLFGFIAGLFGVVFLEFASFLNTSIAWGDRIGFFIVDIMTYSSLSYCLFHFINLGETARRIRLMREIQASPHGLSMDEILERYNAEEILKKRLGRLVSNGQIIDRDGRYYLADSKMLWIARVIIALKALLLGKRSEFEE